ncbi:hypothetical protein HZU75_13160 [Chitinibacter fontanus]|uniref:Uncharacterized protein n=1 Tax=Chitinibacter fontanus TaxID=1737446 RepID=A0A7D5VAZ1_9NEIS|nr:hypothetical protein [Chitinibacter fontanus]QLI82396.1 hypothetical protein HZU75_13160 [Chitinibacter fontanus]
MKRNLLELQHSQTARTVAQLNTLISESSMVCTILAISPHNTVRQPTQTANFNALIVHEHDWYLLRGAPMTVLHQLLPEITTVHRVFFIAELINDLASSSLENAADCLVSLQPCLLCSESRDRLYSLTMPYQGFSEIKLSISSPH